MKVNKGIKKVKKFIAISLSLLCLSSHANVSLAIRDNTNAQHVGENIVQRLMMSWRMGYVIGKYNGRLLENPNLKRLVNGRVPAFNEDFSQGDFRVEIINSLYAIMPIIENKYWNAIRQYPNFRTNNMLNYLRNTISPISSLIGAFALNSLSLIHEHAGDVHLRRAEILARVRRINNIENQDFNFNNVSAILINILNSLEELLIPQRNNVE